MRGLLIMSLMLIAQIAVAQVSSKALQTTPQGSAQKSQNLILKQMIEEQQKRGRKTPTDLKTTVVAANKRSHKKMASLSAQLAENPKTLSKKTHKTPLLPQGRTAQSKILKNSGK